MPLPTNLPGLVSPVNLASPTGSDICQLVTNESRLKSVCGWRVRSAGFDGEHSARQSYLIQPRFTHYQVIPDLNGILMREKLPDLFRCGLPTTRVWAEGGSQGLTRLLTQHFTANLIRCKAYGDPFRASCFGVSVLKYMDVGLHVG